MNVWGSCFWMSFSTQTTWLRENILWGCECNSPIATEMPKEYWSFFFFFLVINISQYISSRQNGSLGICSPAFTPTVSAEHDLALTVPMLFKFQLLKMFRCICFNKCLGEFGILKLGSQKLSETFISVQVSKPCRNISALRQEAPCGIRASPDRVHPILIC